MDHLSLYTAFLGKRYKLKAPLRVIFDASDGTTGPVLKKLNAGRAKVHATYLNAVPDGRFPAHGPNPMKDGALGGLERAVKSAGADLGVAFDGDGDRVFFVDNRGLFVNSDHVAFLLRQSFRPPYLIDVRWGMLLRTKYAVITKVGHYYIKKMMRKLGASFGAEQSGHYYFKDFFNCDSGIFAAIAVMNAVSELKSRGSSLSLWTDALPAYFRIPETNFKVADKEGAVRRVAAVYKRSARAVYRLGGLSMDFKDFWFNIRASNTEPLLRLNLEAGNKKILAAKLKEISALIV